VTRFDGSFEQIAVATRSDLEESLHHGAGAAIGPSGDLVARIGDPDLVVYPRSTLKPLQASALVELGLDIPDMLLAIVCASHDGSVMHLDAVREILRRFDLTESDLGNTPERPLSNTARAEARVAGVEPSALQQNCSGKHAGMLATCRINGWPTDNYLDFDHPLQRAITATMSEFGCTVHNVGIDGCGAPTHALELRSLARSYAAIASSESNVARAMMSHPELVGGPRRDVTIWMQAIPGLMVKEGADGVMAAAHADGRAIAFKIADGSNAARQAVMIEALRAIDVDLGHVSPETIYKLEVPVLGGGRQVGTLTPLEWLR
jgi:L-asparaginase II